MITEDQLEQVAIHWFQDTGWSYVNGTVISPEGGAPEREDRGNIERRTPNIEHRREERVRMQFPNHENHPRQSHPFRAER